MTPAHVETAQGLRSFPPSHAAGEYAEFWHAKLHNPSHIVVANAISSAPTFAAIELTEVFREASIPDWDGYGAAPVSDNTYGFARRFICKLPHTFPLPEVAAEPDGDLCFDWYESSDRQFSVSIDGAGHLHYSGIFGDSKTHGEEKFRDTFPPLFVTFIRRVYGND